MRLNAWLRKALHVLAREGGENLSIDAICSKMGVSKGSFYWHFRNKNDFIGKLLVYYLEYSNMTVINGVEKMDDDPRRKLLAIMEIVQEKRLGRYEVLIRSWSVRNRKVARVIRKAERQRMAYVRSLFYQIGFRGAVLEDRTRLFVAYMRGENVAMVKEPVKGRRERLKRRAAFFTAP